VRYRETKEVGEFWHQITVDMESLSEIMAYIHKWNIKGFLFPSHQHSNEPLSRQAVSLKMDKLAEVIGFNRKLHAHLWCHSLAMYLRERGLPAEAIAFRLVHSSTTVTLANYARLDHNQEKTMLESWNIRLRDE
jgi:site-specific recombinase XerD